MNASTTQRIELLKESGLMNIIEQQNSAQEFIPYLADEKLTTNNFPVFTARKYDYTTKEYFAMLAFDCHFGAKSIDNEVAAEELSRFLYVVDQYKKRF